MKKNYLKVFLLAAAGLLVMWGCATVQGTISPASNAPEVSWIAPKIPESSQRVLVVPVSLEITSDAQLNGYKLTVLDQNNVAVRTIETRAAAPKHTLFGWKVPSVPAPDRLVWDGKNDGG